MSKHGGSPVSGIVQPAGLDQLVSPTGAIIEPAMAREARLEAEKRRATAMETTRRNGALALLPSLIAASNAMPEDLTTSISAIALAIVDDLIAKTGGAV